MDISPWITLLANEYIVSGLSPCEAEDRARRRLADATAITAIKASMQSAVEEMSHGANTVCFDAYDTPSIMVCIPLLRWCDLLDGCNDPAPHPAFCLGRKVLPCIYVGKYLSSLWNGQPASLPRSIPQRWEFFDSAVRDSTQKGCGWNAISFSVRSAIALYSRRNGTLPRGNNNKGSDYFHPMETGELCGEYPVLTGSGPTTWTHDGKASGVWDLNGNLNEWVTGMRLTDGEIQLMDTEEIMRVPQQGRLSEKWYALNEQGDFIPAGSPKALHYEDDNGGIRLTNQSRSHGIGNCAFQDIALQNGLTPAKLLVLQGLYPPASDENQNLGWRWISGSGEVVPLCGGAYRAVDHAGAFFAGMTKPRDVAYPLAGLRLMYISPEHLKEADVL